MAWPRKRWNIHLACSALAGLAMLLQTAALAALDPAACRRLQQSGVIVAGAPVGCDRLVVVRFPYVDFNGVHHDDGELMVLAAVAPEVGQLFRRLHQRGFPLAQARLMDHYQGDDAASMQDNNTSAFNNRQITGGGPPSLHAYGLAIDINPLQNPFVQPDEQGGARISPPAATAYLNRLAVRPGKPVRQGMAEGVMTLFAEYGFTAWGGYWDTPIDYQHFQFSRRFAERLAALPEASARKVYLEHLGKLRKCLQEQGKRPLRRPGTTCALD
jgi:D-alanyl-D-alanine carboxypeptidase